MSLKLRKKDLVEEGYIVGDKTFDVYFSAKDSGLGTSYNYKSLTDVYDRPSEVKKEIWSEWLQWFIDITEDIENDYMCINSYNTSYFTIKGRITINKISYYFYISSSKNILFLV